MSFTDYLKIVIKFLYDCLKVESPERSSVGALKKVFLKILQSVQENSSVGAFSSTFKNTLFTNLSRGLLLKSFFSWVLCHKCSATQIISLLTFDMNFQITKFYLNLKVYDLIPIKTSVLSKNHTNLTFY